jgi:hypothetical protein
MKSTPRYKNKNRNVIKVTKIERRRRRKKETESHRHKGKEIYTQTIHVEKHNIKANSEAHSYTETEKIHMNTEI